MSMQCMHMYLRPKHPLHRLQELVAVVRQGVRILFKHAEQRACLKRKIKQRVIFLNQIFNEYLY